MKTTKVILVAALMAFATIGFSQTDRNIELIKKPPPHLVVKVSLSCALQNAALVGAMRSQLSPNFLQGNQRVYTVRVRFNNTIYYIVGSRAQWKRFFSIAEIAPRGH